MSRQFKITIQAITVLLLALCVGCDSESDEGVVTASPTNEGVVTASPTIEWIRIDGGSFEMGSNVEADEWPIHTVNVPSFEMAKTEVTVAQYRACVDAGECTEPNTYEDCNWGSSGRANHPINCVDWMQARAFSKWVGGDLPSEAQWEYAARSQGQEITYPWGNEEPDCTLVNFDECVGKTAFVCSKPLGNTAQGLCDMSGSVWEWVLDEYKGSYKGAPTDGTPVCSTPACEDNGSRRVVRGGSWFNGADYLRAAYRGRGGSDFRRYLGFRPLRTTP
jgi:formylglycine-generating enzyme required for sulfatase activity